MNKYEKIKKYFGNLILLLESNDIFIFNFNN